MAKILIVATAGLKSTQLEDIDNVQNPRVDYLLLKQQLDVDVINYNAYHQTRMGSFFRRLETRVRSDLYLAFLAKMMTRKYQVVFTMSERAGIPYAGAQRAIPSRNSFITMFKCWSKRQEWTIENLRLFNAMDEIIVHCPSMEKRLTRLGADPNKLHLIHYGIDHQFFRPRPKENCNNPILMSIGEIRSRDYPTFFKAVDGLPAEVHVAASGAWYAREKKRDINLAPPKNVTLTGRLSHLQLRELYSNSNFVVLPILDLPYSAGATGVLEAGAMGRAVIVTCSRGITDYVIDGETGILVDQGDETGLREAINYLLAHPAEAARMGQNARQRIEEEMNIDIFVKSVGELLSIHAQ